tara:strand:+ start:1449 stop:1940 length:492 start_codon:yes stop_codon:yes gene_type:complete
MKRSLLKPNFPKIGFAAVGFTGLMAVFSGGLSLAATAVWLSAGSLLGMVFSVADNISHNESLNHKARMEAVAKNRKKESVAHNNSLMPVEQVVWNPIRYSPDGWTGDMPETGRLSQIKAGLSSRLDRINMFFDGKIPAEKSDLTMDSSKPDQTAKRIKTAPRC